MRTLFIALYALLFSCTSIASTNPSFEEVVQKVLLGFHQQDTQIINSLINKDIGIYIVYKRGIPYQYEQLSQFDFKQPVPEYLPYESLSEKLVRANSKITQYKTAATFDCDTERWSPTGLSVGKTGNDHLLSETATFLKLHEMTDMSDKEIADLKKFESVSRRIVLASNDGEELVFHLGYFNQRWYLTVLDRVSSDCSA